MELSNLFFNYNIKDKKFSYINYEFKLIADPESKKKLIEMAKSSLQKLEKIVKSNYNSKQFKKLVDGEVTPSKIEFGYVYTNSIWNMLIRGINSAGLNYKLLIDSEGKPSNLNLNLNNRDHNSERLFRLYDSVREMPNLKISDEAQIQIDKIDYLRSGKFDTKEVLNLIN